MQQEALAYVQHLLIAGGADVAAPAVDSPHMPPERPFRRRSKHIQRVCMWLERLIVQGGVDDPDALRLAAAFHDAGYLHAAENHGQHSAALLRAYARSRDIPPAAVERAVWLVREHSAKKRWLSDPAAPRDLILLMEADSLDEEGAMGIVFDCMSAATLGAEGFEDAYARMQRFEPARLKENPLVTPLARAFWAEKQRIIREFMAAFAFDLGLEEAP